MLSRWLAFVVWALLGATVVTWLLQTLAQPGQVPAHAVPVDMSASLRTDMTRLFGAKPAAAVDVPQARGDERLKLIGLVTSTSPTEAGSSLALIALDGKPARSYRVGAVVDGDRRVLAVRKTAVDIGPSGGPVAFTLTLPGLPPAATGTPQSAGGSAPTIAPGVQPPTMPSGTLPQIPNMPTGMAPQAGMDVQPQQPPSLPPPIEAQPISPPQAPPARPG